MSLGIAFASLGIACIIGCLGGAYVIYGLPKWMRKKKIAYCFLAVWINQAAFFD